MLQYLRTHQKTFLWILLAFITVPFIVYYGAPGGGSQGGPGGPMPLAAEVNGKPVYLWQYEEVRTDLLDSFQRQANERGTRVTAAQQRQAAERAFNAVVERELLLQKATELGIEVTHQEALEAGSEFFQQLHQQFTQSNPSLTFDETVNFYLNQYVRGGTREQKQEIFLQDQRTSLLQQKMYNLPGYGTLVSEEDVLREFRNREEQARAEYLIFDRDAYLDEVADLEPAEDALTAWFESHRDAYKQGARAKVRYARFRVEDFEEEARQGISTETIQREFNSRANEYSRPEPEGRRFDFVTFAADRFIQEASYTEADVQNWFETHRDTYSAPERARVRFIAVNLDTFRDDVTIDEVDIVEQYNNTLRLYAKEEAVELSHILAAAPKVTTPDVEEAARARIADAQARLAAGEDFNALAAEVSDDPGSATGYLGLVTKSSGFVDVFKEAGLALSEGEVTAEPVRSEFGYHLIKAGKRIAASTQTLDEVRDQIRETLTRSRLRDVALHQLRNLRNRLEDGLTAESIGDAYPIYETVAFAQDEREPVDANISRNDMWSFARSAFSLGEGEVSQVVQGENTFYLIERTARIAPEETTLDDEEVRRTVIAELTDARASQLAFLEADKALQTVRDEGLSLWDLASRFGMNLRQSSWVTQRDFNVDGVGSYPTQFLSAVFAASAGEIVAAVGPDGSAHVVRVEAIRPEKTPKFEDLDTRTVNQIADTLIRKSASLAAQRAAARFLSNHSNIRAASASEEAFAALGPNVTTGVTDYIGAGSEIEGLGFVAELNEAALTLCATGTEPGTWYDQLIEDRAGSQYIIQLVDCRAEGIPPFEETRDRVLEDYRKEKAAELAKAAAEAALKQVGVALAALPAGASPTLDLAGLAEAHQYDYRVVAELTRNNAYLENVGPSIHFAKAAFNLEPGAVSGIITITDPFGATVGGEEPVRAYAILRVLSRTAADEADLKAQMADIRRELEFRHRQTAFRAWLDAVRSQSNIKDLRDVPQA